MSKTTKEIDIIIPAYNAEKSLDITLMSICMQSIVDKVNVIIVDDKSDCSYDALLHKYQSYMSIELIKCNTNCGPGKARQVGLSNAHCKYVTFIDADDVFATSTALFNLYNELEKNEKTCIISSTFQEEIRNDGEFVGYLDHKNDLTWMFGKMYRKSFLDKYKINFNDSRANEDSGFNGLCLMCAEEGSIVYQDRLVYCWNYNESSITKNNDYSYTGLNGFIHNHIWSIHKALENGANENTILAHTVNIMSIIYIYYQGLIREGRSIEQIEEFIEWALDFYRDVYIQLRDKIGQSLFTAAYINTFNQHKDSLSDFIPTNTVFDFLNLIDGKLMKKLGIRQALDEQGNRLGYVKANLVNPTEKDIIKCEELDEFKKTGIVMY